jgi:hypothetical protein
MSINPHRLKKGKQYIIKHHDTGKIYKGIFDFMTSIMIIMKNDDKKIQFMYDDDFYDVEDIKEKSRRAKQAMEQRALDKLLKKIVNENFEW